MYSKKKMMSLALCAALSAAVMTGCGQQTEEGTSADAEKQADTSAAAELIADIPTVQAFTDEAVAEEDVDAILSAGINAPSAMNGQNWHFTAVTDADVLQQIADGMSAGMPSAAPTDAASDSEDESADSQPPEAPAAASAGAAKAGITDAPLAIVVSSTEGSEFDAGLACQNMSAEAQLLGYGTKIISSPTIALNGDSQQTYRELLGIPSDQSAVAVLLIGREDTSLDADSVTAATERNSADEMTTRVD